MKPRSHKVSSRKLVNGFSSVKNSASKKSTSLACTSVTKKNDLQLNLIVSHNSPLVKKTNEREILSCVDDSIGSRVRQMSRHKNRPCYQEIRRKINTDACILGKFYRKWKRIEKNFDKMVIYSFKNFMIN